jgi:hypothetical protein
VTILNNSVDDYQKNGITANETGTSVTINRNIVVRLGPANGATQNGIQIGFVASGLISNDNVSNHVWASCLSLTQCDTDATGVLIFQSDNVQANGNSIGTYQIGIFTNGNKTPIASNHISKSLVLDFGILLEPGGGRATIISETSSSRY